MSNVGTQPIYVSYTEETITKSTSYTITIKDEPTPELELSTIEEIRQMCLALPSPIAGDNIKIVTSETKVKFIAQAIDYVDTKNSKKGHTPRMKVIVGDSTGYILAASEPGNASQNTLYQSFSNNKKKNNSKYTLEGYIGMYRGQPEVVISSFTWDENLPITYNVDDYSKGLLADVPAFYDTVIDVTDYNSKGSGIGQVFEIDNVRCIGKADDNSWIFCDATSKVMGIYDWISNTSFDVGSVYNVIGLLSTTEWKPSLRSWKYELVQNVDVDEPFTNNHVDTQVKPLFDLKRPDFDDDDYRRYPDYLRSFMNIYRSDVYFDYYSDSNSGIVACDTYYASAPSGKDISASRYCIRFNNEYYNWANLNGYYGENKTVTIYYSLYAQEKITYGGKKYFQWKVYMYPETLELE